MQETVIEPQQKQTTLTFNDFKLAPTLSDGLAAMQFTQPTPIQEQAIPLILDKHDLIAYAQTGTGKTAAYLLPILHQIEVQTTPNQYIKCLIVAPTRELALQIDQQLEGFSYFTQATSFPVYGGGDGADFIRQKKALIKGTDIIIATPGKLLSHLNLGYINFDHLEHFILDEADKMLDMGFLDDIMKIASNLPRKRQTLLFSATMPDKIRQLSSKVLSNPKQINIAVTQPAEGIFQAAYLVHHHQKIGLLKHVIGEKKETVRVIIFGSTKNSVKDVTQALLKMNWAAGAIHSDLKQNEREEVLRKFRNERIQILVATDILSRGIDIKDVNLIINFDIPHDIEDYVHRIGRTARADATGMAITFVDGTKQRKFQKIANFIKQKIRKLSLPKHLGDAPAFQSFSNKKSDGKNRSKGNKKHFKPHKKNHSPKK